jgi:hypothetical protein
MLLWPLVVWVFDHLRSSSGVKMTSSLREGGEAYLKDLPHAEMHRLNSGHLAVEDCLADISTNMHRFYREKVAV